MSIDLIVEVLDHAPEKLTPSERLVLVVIAEWANDKTRVAKQTKNWNLDTICRRAGIQRSGLKSVLQRLAKNGLEVRVPVRWKDGKPVYAYEGTAVTFKLPVLDASRGDATATPQRGGHSNPTEPRGGATASERGGCGIREGGPQQPPSPQGSPLKKNPSSLSARDADPAPAPAGDRERDGSGKIPNEQTPDDLIAGLLIGAGCPPARTGEVRRHYADKGAGWFVTLNGRGHLAAHVAAALAALSTDVPGTPAGRCGWHPWESGGGACRACAGEANGREPAAVLPSLMSPGRVIRSAADQRVADGAVLYAKYAALDAAEAAGEGAPVRVPPL